MREVMRHFDGIKNSLSEPPRILGLTASIIQKKCNPYKVSQLLKDLENTMQCHLITTVHHDEVLRYTTRPKEIIFEYNNGLSPQSEHTKRMQLELASMISDVESDSSIDRKDTKKLRNILTNISITLTELGEWCGSKAIEYEVEHFKDLSFEADEATMRILMAKLYKRLDVVRQQCRTAELGFSNIEQHISHHVAQFLNLLAPIMSQIDMHILVFVETRVSAFLLCELLTELKTKNQKYSNVSPQFVVGANSSSSSGFDIAKNRISLARLEEALKGFRNGASNVLMSTSVLEEGVDIRKCNVVVRFDKPSNFRSYVQSKGRARAPNSMYILMASPDSELPKELKEYHALETSFRKICRDRALPLDDEIKESFQDNLLEPFMPKGLHGPRITSASCMSCIYRYCDKLPQDRFTNLAPTFKVIRASEGAFLATLELPRNSPCHEITRSNPMPDEDWAKKDAALQMCKILYEYKELNESLQPFKKVLAEEELLKAVIGDASDSLHDDSAGKNITIYKRSVCSAFSDSAGEEWFIYHLNLDHAVKIENCEIFDGSHSLALICPKQTMTASFPLFSNKWGKISVSVDAVKTIKLTNNCLQAMRGFTKFIFHFLLDINDEVLEYSDASLWKCLFAPVRKEGFDIDMMNKVTSMNTMRITEPSEEERKSFSFDADKYKDAIVMPWYKPRAVFDVCKITRHKPDSDTNFKKKIQNTGSRGNFREYILDNYSVKVFCSNQYLIDCRNVPGELRCLKPVDASLKARTGAHPCFIPELCCLLPIPSHLYHQISLLPSILQRLNGVNIAGEYIAGLARLPCGLEESTNTLVALPTSNKEPLDYHWCSRLTNQVSASHPSGNVCVALQNKEKMRFDVFNAIVLPGLVRTPLIALETIHVLQTLTPRAGHEVFDFERLELLGDSFLKFHVSQALFLTYPEWNEGKLTANRSQLVSNNTLHRLGIKMGLPSVIQSRSMVPKESGPAPGFVVKPHMERNLKQLKVPYNKWHDFKPLSVDDQGGAGQNGKCYNPWTEQPIRKKTVPDSVEAQLGMVLLSCGDTAGHQFLIRLGFPVEKALSVPTTAISPWLIKESASEDTAAEAIRLYDRCNLAGLEKILGYHFNNKSFLLQAVTHPSFSVNKVSDIMSPSSAMDSCFFLHHV